MPTTAQPVLSSQGDFDDQDIPDTAKEGGADE